MSGIQLMFVGSGPGRKAIALTIGSNTSNYNILTAASSAGYSAGKSDITVTISPGVYVSSTSTGTPALASGALTTGDTLSITNNGVIVGDGGNGGAGGNGGGAGYSGLTAGSSGGAGGTAVTMSYPATVNNLGTFNGGGGGGGGGGAVNANSSSIGGAGGGGGLGGGSGGPAGSSNGQPGSSPGNAGSVTAAGSGGPTNQQGPYISGGAGGAGGGAGSAGSSGSPGSNGGLLAEPPIVTTSGGGGGAAGAAVTGNSYITYTNTGTRNGAIVP